MIVNHPSAHVQVLRPLPTVPISCRVWESLRHAPVKMVGCSGVEAIWLSISSHLKRIGCQCHLREIGIAVACPSIAAWSSTSFKVAQKGVICSASASLCSNVAYHSLTVWTEHVSTFLGVTSTLPVVSCLFIWSSRASLRRVPRWHIVVGCVCYWAVATVRSVISAHPWRIVPLELCSLLLLVLEWTTVCRTIVAIVAITEVSPLQLLLWHLFTVLVLVIIDHLVMLCLCCVCVFIGLPLLIKMTLNQLSN